MRESEKIRIVVFERPISRRKKFTVVVCIRIESVTITLAEAQELIKEKIPDLTITTTVVHVGNRSVIEVRCAEKEVSITKLQGRVREVMKDYQITVWNYVAGRPRLNPRR